MLHHERVHENTTIDHVPLCNVASHVAEYYQQEVNGVSWSYVNSYYGCGWVKSEFIGLWN